MIEILKLSGNQQFPKNHRGLTGVEDFFIYWLGRPVKMLDKKKGRICLPDDDRKPPNGHKCYLAGWGNQSEGARISPDKLRHVEIKLVPHKECNKKESYGGTISKTLLCAGYKEGGKGQCLNDNGGSLVCNVDGKQSFIFISEVYISDE